MGARAEAGPSLLTLSFCSLPALGFSYGLPNAVPGCFSSSFPSLTAASPTG